MTSSREFRDDFQVLNRLLLESAPGSIQRVCSAVEDCIANNKDKLRGFFDKCFPNLLKRVFGYDDHGTSWINLVTKSGKEEDSRALVRLLSPQGKLFAAMHSADADQLIKYIFPLERLPAHTQELLKRPSGRLLLDTWPQYRQHIHGAPGGLAVYLNVFEYFVFWSAFYVLRGRTEELSSRGQSRGVSSSVSGGLGYMQRVGSSLLHSSSHNASGGTHAYFQLLRLYLEHFLPRMVPVKGTGVGGAAGVLGVGTVPTGSGSGGAQLALLHSMSAGRQHASGSSAAGAAEAPPGDVLLSVLLEFWLSDAAEPVPADVSERGTGAGTPGGTGGTPGSTLALSGAAASPGGAVGGGVSLGVLDAAAAAATTSMPSNRIVSFQAPSDELVESLTSLMRYIHVVDSGRGQPLQPAQAGPAWLPETPVCTVSTRMLAPPPSALSGSHASLSVQAVSRKLYRFLRRAFAQWPVSSSAALTPVVDLWLVMVAPWRRPCPPPASTAHQAGGTHPGHFGAELAQRLHLPHGGRDGGHGGADSGGRASSQPAQAPGYGPEWRSHVQSHLPMYSLLRHFLELTYARLSYKAEAALADLQRVLTVLAAEPTLLGELQQIEKAVNRYIHLPSRRPDGEYGELASWAADQAQDWEAAATAGAPSQPPMQADAMFRLFSIDEQGAPFYASAVLKAAEMQVRPELLRGVADLAFKVLPLSDLPAVQQRLPPRDMSFRFPRAGRWQDVSYKGDWLMRPIASNEVGPVVRWSVRASVALNRWLGLDRPLTAEEEEEMPEDQVQALGRWLRRRNYRVDLRFLAEKQLLAWLAVAAVAWWLLRSIPSGMLAEPPGTSSTDATLPPPVVQELQFVDAAEAFTDAELSL